MVKQISDNEIYLLIKYIKSILWTAAKCLSYTEDARCLKVKQLHIYCLTLKMKALQPFKTLATTSQHSKIKAQNFKTT